VYRAAEAVKAYPERYRSAVPLYVDRHDVHGVSPDEIAEAHYRDLEVQERHGVRYHTYWFDPAEGSVFCLAEGPSKKALETVHREAHGFLASLIIEVEPETPLNGLFVSLPNHRPREPYIEPAVRSIVFTDICGSVEQTQILGDEGHMQLLAEHNRIVRAALVAHDGREVKHTGDGIMAAFTSVSSAIRFAVEVQMALETRNEGACDRLDVSIGISAGEPVTDDSDDLFGAAVQLSARLCSVAEAGEIAVSVAVRELCLGKDFQFVDHGRVHLKGMPEATPVHLVRWGE
jgi:class 3 adenylate cyclase